MTVGLATIDPGASTDGAPHRHAPAEVYLFRSGRGVVHVGDREVPVEVRVGLSDADKQQLAEDLNLHRRHLSREQLRLFVERRLKRTPEQSNRRIAAELGVDKNTVESVRCGLQATGEIHQLNKTVGADGKARPARRRPAVVRGAV